MTRLRKILSSLFFTVAFMCVGISFIVFCVFLNRTHDWTRTAEIGIPAAILLALLGVIVYPGRLPVPGGH